MPELRPAVVTGGPGCPLLTSRCGTRMARRDLPHFFPVPSHPACLCVGSAVSRVALAPSRQRRRQAPLMPTRRRRTIPGACEGTETQLALFGVNSRQQGLMESPALVRCLVTFVRLPFGFHGCCTPLLYGRGVIVSLGTLSRWPCCSPELQSVVVTA